MICKTLLTIDKYAEIWTDKKATFGGTAKVIEQCGEFLAEGGMKKA